MNTQPLRCVFAQRIIHSRKSLQPPSHFSARFSSTQNPPSSTKSTFASQSTHQFSPYPDPILDQNKSPGNHHPIPLKTRLGLWFSSLFPIQISPGHSVDTLKHSTRGFRPPNSNFQPLHQPSHPYATSVSGVSSSISSQTNNISSSSTALTSEQLSFLISQLQHLQLTLPPRSGSAHISSAHSSAHSSFPHSTHLPALEHPVDWIRSFKKWLFSYQYLSIVVGSGVGIVSVIGLSYLVYGRLLEQRLSKLAVDLTTTTLASNQTQTSVLELTETIIHDQKVMHNLQWLFITLVQDPVIQEILINTGQNLVIQHILQNKDVQIELVQLLSILFKDPTLQTHLADIIKYILSRPDIQQQLISVCVEALRDPDLQNQTAESLVGLWTLFSTDPATYDNLRYLLESVLRDQTIINESSTMLWKTVKSAFSWGSKPVVNEHKPDQDDTAPTLFPLSLSSPSSPSTPTVSPIIPQTTPSSIRPQTKPESSSAYLQTSKKQEPPPSRSLSHQSISNDISDHHSKMFSNENPQHNSTHTHPYSRELHYPSHSASSLGPSPPPPTDLISTPRTHQTVQQPQSTTNSIIEKNPISHQEPQSNVIKALDSTTFMVNSAFNSIKSGFQVAKLWWGTDPSPDHTHHTHAKPHVPATQRQDADSPLPSPASTSALQQLTTKLHSHDDDQIHQNMNLHHHHHHELGKLEKPHFSTQYTQPSTISQNDKLYHQLLHDEYMKQKQSVDSAHNTALSPIDIHPSTHAKSSSDPLNTNSITAVMPRASTDLPTSTSAPKSPPSSQIQQQ